MTRSSKIKNKLVAVLIVSISTLTFDTIFVAVGAKDE